MPEVFYYEKGLFLATPRLAVDAPRRQASAFISHAHADHMGRHAYALCTPETGALYQHRLGRRHVREMSYGETIEWGGVNLTAHPAGHCLGSAMLHVEDEGRTMLYTGDFQLTPSETSERADPPNAETLIMETTFGDPRFRFPAREKVIDQLCETVATSIREGKTPVVGAYALGKSQEATKILTDAGFPVRQHRSAYEISLVYEKCGVSLGDFSLLSTEQPLQPGEVLIVPPHLRRGVDVENETRIAVTGWALDSSAQHRLRADHAIPLSDHADYDELLELIDRVAPQRVYCTHGDNSFVNDLQERGIDAYRLGGSTQKRLF